MKRVELFLGCLFLVVIYFAWNWFFPGEKILTGRYGELIRTRSAFSPISLPVLITSVLVWYALCWINIVNEWNRRPVLRFGRYVATKGPGLCFIEPIIHNTLPDVYIKDVVEEIDPDNEIQTKDNIGILIVGILTYRIMDVQKSVINVQDIHASIRKRAYSSLTDEIGKIDLDYLLTQRDQFCQTIQETLRQRTADWGVGIQAFELKSFEINDDELAQAIALRARAQKEGQAELVRAQMQKQISETLNDAAAVLDDKGWMLKNIEALLEMSRSANMHTVILQSDVLSGVGHTAALTSALANHPKPVPADE